ncbi:MAG: thioredoxin domain-containing protein [bacterium]|nr:thioredoxin domain-containing protein [bacterium]
MNRLQHETSPYLLQHAENPVEWYPWGEEALGRAKAEDKPILLSIGYSACHWCHVMAHESFEDAATARLMNELFINIKVDREERPDVDDIYMNAVQALTGGGGWPMTMFLLPDGRPFYGGTYYPKEARYGMPSFTQVMQAVHNAYATRRAEMDEMAGKLTDALRRDTLNLGGLSDNLTPELLDAAAKKMLANADRTNGGFGGAPKFPQPMNLEFLLRAYARTGDQAALDHVLLTLRKMARGGMYDQIGGGFARYSVDAVWLVPHFEKMLYDNAQLSRVYLHAWQITGDAFYRRIAEEIYDYVLREMTSPEGGFYSATDADSEGEEGKFFVWSQAELETLLGDDARIAIEYWGVTPGGNFEGHNILYVPNDDDIAAARLGLTVDALRTRLNAIRDKLFAERTHRVHPGLDDKIIVAWNGLMLASLAEAARILARADYRISAIRSADFLLDSLKAPDGRLHRTYKGGQAKGGGYLEDYACLIEALIDVYQLTFDERYFTEARALADRALAHFRAADGGFFDTSDTHETLIVRPRSLQDNAVPSGNAMFARVLIRLMAYTGESAYEEAARRTLNPLANAMREYPQAFGEGLNAIDALVTGIAEIALVGSPAADDMQLLLRALYAAYRPNVITALAAANVDGEAAIPLLSYRTMKNGAATVYVCRHFACQMPVTTPDALQALL